MSIHDRDGWVPSPGPWVPPEGARPGWDWTPSPYGMRPRTDAMPLWVKVWFRIPLLDRRAREYMWHIGYWWVAPSPDWDENDARQSIRLYLRRSRVGSIRLRLMRRSRWKFGIRWSPAFHILIWVAAVLVGFLGPSWRLGLILGVVGEAVLAVISLWAGRKLGRRTSA